MMQGFRFHTWAWLKISSGPTAVSSSPSAVVIWFATAPTSGAMPTYGNGSPASPTKESIDETQPLLRPGLTVSPGKLWTVAAVFGLTLSWCVLDMWNRHASANLFAVEQVKDLHVSGGDLKA